MSDSKSDASKPELGTFAQLSAKIPEGWRRAEVFVSPEIGQSTKILRLSLQRDTTGRKVIFFHSIGFTR